MMINGEKFELFLDEEEIRKRVKELALSINSDYSGKAPVFIGVLNGSFIFLADLIREIDLDCELDFIKISSYGNAKNSSGKVGVLKELNCSLKGRDVIVVEDIIDSGMTLDFIRKTIEKEKPKSLKTVTLLLKKGTSSVDLHADYVGFEIPPDFVVGYGLDYGQKVRNLKGIFRLNGV
jgi:hypoxanthine phosphoribosyltransferase